MARIFVAGFEGGDSDVTKFTTVSGATVVSSSGLSMDGSYCLRLGGSLTGYASLAVTSDDEMYAAFLFRKENGSTSGMISFFSGTTPIASLLSLTGTELLAAYMGTGTFLALSAISLAEDTTYLIEVYYKLADSGGRFSVKVNGISAFDFTGDTKPGADSTFNIIKFGYNSSMAAVYGNAVYDNIILDTTSWIGKTYIQKIVPDGAGATTNFTASTGANYTCVDEVPAVTTDYVYSNTNNHVDTYTAGALTGTIGTIKSVSVNAYAIKEGSATPQNLQLVTRPGSTDRVSASVAIPTSYAVLQGIWEVNPDTSAAWAESEVNATEIGVKVVA